MIQDRTSVLPKTFTELALGLSDVLKVALSGIYKSEIFLSGTGVSDFSSFVSCKKSIACLTLSEKRLSEAAWVIAFVISCGLLAGGIFVRQCRMD